MTVWHKAMTQAKWNAYSLESQILMVGSEFARVKVLERDGVGGDTRLCYERAMELLDWCTGDPKWHTRLKELTRFREVLGTLYLDHSTHDALFMTLYTTLMSWTGTTSRVRL